MNKKVFSWMAVLLLAIFIFVFAIFQVFASSVTDIGGHQYEDIVQFLIDEDVISGYDDHTYRPDTTVNRAEFLKVVVRSAYGDAPAVTADEDCDFSDTEAGAWYIPYLCFSVDEGIVKGYSDGTFKPANTINFVEASKIVSLAYGKDLSEDTGGQWYAEYIQYASDNLLIPPDVDSFNESITRGQMAELLGRFLLNERSELTAYLQSHEFDMVVYDKDANTLSQEPWAYQGADWLTYSDLSKTALDVSGEGWSLSAEAGENEQILANYSADFSDGTTVNIASGDYITVDVTKDDSDGVFLYSQVYDTTVTGETSIDLDEDLDSEGSASYSDDETECSWSSSMLSGVSTYVEDFSWGDGTNSFEHAIGDDTFSENFIVDNSDGASSSSRDKADFIYVYEDSPSEGPIHNWIWESADGSLIVNQVMKDDYYSEYLGFAPTGLFSILLEYDQEIVSENLSLQSDDGSYTMNLFMDNDVVEENIIYESDSLSTLLVLAESKTLDGTISAQNESGDIINVDIVDGQLDGVSVQAENEDSAMYLYYDGESDSVSATLYDSGEWVSVISDGEMVEHGITTSTDEISVTSDGVNINNSLYVMDFDAVEDRLSVLWNEDDGDASQNGYLLFEDGIEYFDVDLDFGDEEKFNEADSSDETVEWYKKFGIGLSLGRYIAGDQEGGVKGYGVNKTWTLGFSHEDAELRQKALFEKDGFEKDLDAYASLSDYAFREKMLLKGTYKGVDVNIDTNVDVENGRTTGSGKMTVAGESIQGEFTAEFGTNQRMVLGGQILISPLSRPGMTFGLGLENDGETTTVRPEWTVPLYSGGGLDIGTVFGGEFKTDGTSRGGARIDVTHQGTGITVGVGGRVSEGGHFDADFSVGYSAGW